MYARAAVVTALVGASLFGAGPAGSTPSHDSFAGATPIAELPFFQSSDTKGATLELGEPTPSCAPARSSIWYAFTSDQALNLVAESTSAVPTALSIYRGTDFTSLEEVACSFGRTRSSAAFRAVPGNAYFLQIVDTSRRQGAVDFSLVTDQWQERELFSVTQPVVVAERKLPLLTIDGKPRPADPSMYDLSIKAADQAEVKRGILTFGLVNETVHQELVDLPRIAASVTTSIAYRYDASQYRCLSDGGEGQPCNAKSPIKDLGWLTSGEGSKAELVIRISVEKENGDALVERTIAIPYAGQLAGLP